MSRIEADNKYLEIHVASGESYTDAVSSIRAAEEGTMCRVSLDKGVSAEATMDILAAVLCGKWLEDDPEEKLS